MFRTTRKASVIICLTSRKNYGSMKRHFYCDEDVIRHICCGNWKNSSQKSRESFVTVDKVADARMEELEASLSGAAC